MRILIMEDDRALGLFLQKGLNLEGHEARLATDGETGLQLALDGAFDLIVLDLSLPQMDGVEVLREMREQRLDASILVLTGRIALSDRLRCLDLGADDYLMKPFSFSELTARCRSLMRRRERFADPLLRQGGLELHRMERKVVRNGRAVELTVKEFALLEYLMLARGRTCSRSELLREVWQMSPDAGTNVVDVYVNYLRKKLGTFRDEIGGVAGGISGIEADQEAVIDTVRGEGYSLSCTRKPVRAASLDDAAGGLLAPGRGLLGGRADGLAVALRGRASA